MNKLILVLCMMWGSNWISMKAAGNYFPPTMFSALRFSLGALVLFIIIFYKRVPLPKKGDWKWLAVCGLLQTSLQYYGCQIALQYVNAGIVCILCFSMPLWFAIMAHFLIPGERITWNKGIGLIMGFTGLFFVMHINPFHMKWNGIELLFELLALSGGIGWAISNVIIKRKLQNVDNFQFTTYQMAIGAVALLGISFAVEPGQQVVWNLTSIACVFYAGVIASALGYFLWFHILSKVDTSKATVTVLLVPVFGAISVWLAFGESMNVTTIMGMALVVSGIAIVTGKWRKTVRLSHSG
jgi:O-acetylserine/cysteine efflux transporter